jgi:hypothetical protein
MVGLKIKLDNALRWRMGHMAHGLKNRRVAQEVLCTVLELSIESLHQTSVFTPSIVRGATGLLAVQQHDSMLC